MVNINQEKLAEIFTDTVHHKNVAKIIHVHSTNKLDVRIAALDGLQLQYDKIAMDIGCGFGFFTLALKDRLFPGSSILGIDICTKYSASYLESCKTAGLQGKFSGQGEKAITTIPTDSVDLVICSYALYFFPGIIQEVSRILKSSGVFVIITHSENHLVEIISFIRETFDILSIQTPESFPCQDLISGFNSSNGHQLLSPWFGKVKEKEYHNSICFEISDFEDLEKYFRFKQPHFIPDYLDSKNIIYNKMMYRLRKYLQSGNHFNITKDDTIFICKEPLSNK